MKHLAWIAAIVACILAGAAFTVSLTHSGPRGVMGPQGIQGIPGRVANVQQARYGICWTEAVQLSNGVTFVSSVDIEPPQISNGVYQCPQGETFVTIQPLPLKQLRRSNDIQDRGSE